MSRVELHRHSFADQVCVLLLMVFLALAVVPNVAFADITSGKYGVAQVFDCKRSPADPIANQLFTASDFLQPLADIVGNRFNATKYDIGTGYIQFFYTGNPGYPVGTKLYAADGTFIETISAMGQIWGLGSAGFLYVSLTGDWGTFVANNLGYNYGGTVTYKPTTGQALTSDLLAYTATATPLQAGQSATSAQPGQPAHVPVGGLEVTLATSMLVAGYGFSKFRK